MATFRTEDDWHRYYAAEGFQVGEAACLACGFKATVALFPETPKHVLECGNCSAQRSTFRELPAPKRP